VISYGETMSKLAEAGMKLSAPFNHDRNLLGELVPYASIINSIYFPPPPNIMGTGRPWRGPEEKEYENELPNIISEIRQMGVEPELLLNSIWNNVKEYTSIISFVGQMMDLGVKRIIIADMHLATTLRVEYPDILFSVSCVAFVHNAMRADYWRVYAGADRIVIDPSINKNLIKIREIAKLGLEIEIMPVNCCMPWCPFQAQHYFAVSRDTEICAGTGNHIEAFCKPMRNDPDIMWRQYVIEVMPGDLTRYAGLASIVKIAGRDDLTSKILRRIKLYSECSSRYHPDEYYFEPEEVFDMVASCGDCISCGRCKDIFMSANPEIKPGFGFLNRR
jgi:collagenase-like PrtC family protease